MMKKILRILPRILKVYVHKQKPEVSAMPYTEWESKYKA
jgi:hypothetical protein